MKAATDIILSPKEDISLIESFALVMYICLYKFDYTWISIQQLIFAQLIFVAW